MEDVYFIPFPKPNRNKEKCLRRIKACFRSSEQLNANKIRDMYYVYSKHFEGEFDLILQCPDPFSADPFVTQKSERQKKCEKKSLRLKIFQLNLRATKR